MPEGEWVLLLMDANGRTHIHEDVKRLCFENKILAWFGEPDTTSEWQPVDAGIGKTLKGLALGDEVGLEKWLLKKANRKKWSRSTVNSQLRRQLSMKFIGAAWNKMQDGYENLRRAAWERTGALLTADGSLDHVVAPQGLQDYELLPASAAAPDGW